MDIFLIALGIIGLILLILGWVTNKVNHPGDQPGEYGSNFLWFLGNDARNDGGDSSGDDGGDSFDGGSADGGGGDSSSF